MIVRLVTMRFQPGKGQEFLRIFTEACNAIRSQRGCLYLTLLSISPDALSPSTPWASLADLAASRHSDLFCSIWPRLKAIFREPAWAESFEIVSLPNHNAALEMAQRLTDALSAALAN